MSGSLARTALVTGGTGGVGSHVCRLLAGAGVDVTFTYHRNTVASDALVAELAEAPGRVRGVRADTGDAVALRDVVAAASVSGGLDILIHAGGPVVPQKYVSAINRAEFARHVEEEVIAFFGLVEVALPALRIAQGALVAITTVAGRHFPVKDVLSSAPKAGIEALIRAVAKEEGRFGVRANAVGPGIMSDGMAATLHEVGDFTVEAQEQVLRTIPLRRFGSSRDVAEVAVFLASESARYVTGQVIDVDGGHSL